MLSSLSRHALGRRAIAVNRIQNQIADILRDRPPVLRRGSLKRRPQRRLNPNRQLLTLARVLCHPASVARLTLNSNAQRLHARARGGLIAPQDRAHPVGSLECAPEDFSPPAQRRAFSCRRQSPTAPMKKPRHFPGGGAEVTTRRKVHSDSRPPRRAARLSYHLRSHPPSCRKPTQRATPEGHPGQPNPDFRISEFRRTRTAPPTRAHDARRK